MASEISSRVRRALVGLLVAAWLARIGLAAGGGQYFFPDELRFDRALELAAVLGDARVGDAFGYLFARADHTGWIVAALPAAVIARTLAEATGRVATDFAYFVAMLYSLASVGCIAMIFVVSRRLGASSREAFVAATLLALTSSFLYWSRHLVPYDISMLLALGAVAVGLRGNGVWRTVGCGLLAGTAFAVYNGYWVLAGLALASHTLVGSRRASTVALRAVVGGAAFAAPTLLFLLGSRIAGRADGLTRLQEFAGSVKQGDWSEGFTLPMLYFFAADTPMALVWAAALAASLAWIVWRPSRPAAPATSPVSALLEGRLTADPTTRLVLLLGAVAFVYVTLATGAGVLRIFVVYGRLSRQLVPFLCLLTACIGVALWDLLPPSRRRVVGFGAIAVLCWQMWAAVRPPFTLTFPRELEKTLFEYGPLDHALTVDGPRPRPGAAGARYVLLNAQYLYPPRGHQPPPPGTTLFSIAHPLQYRPYTYEGFRRFERAVLESGDISMRLVDRLVASPTGTPGRAQAGEEGSGAPAPAIRSR